MRVKLRNNWFASNDTLYRKGDDVEIPDDLADSLPKTAIFVEGMDTRPKPRAYPVQTLRDFDEVRKVTDAEGEIAERTHAEQEAINLRMAKARAARKTNAVSDKDE